jgi:aspartyl-tRNA(Asn)/glutamyl-tRNA(Gln) amidotransferase subunit A
MAELVRAGRLSAREACEQALARAQERAELGAFWHLAAEAALAEAARVDDAVARGEDPGRLAGVPVAVKDSFDVEGMPGGAGGPVRVGERDAEAVRRLRAAGAVVVGKLAMHQLGFGMSGQTPGRPLCRNPYAPGRQPGGSSSGSGAAVAARIVPLALGADSGGSVRVPAAWCGVVGYKPARAAVPTAGLVPLSPAFDTVGVLAATLDDTSLADGVLRLAPEPSPPVGRLRLGVVRRLLAEADAPVREACEAALARLDAELVDAELPVRGVRVGPIFAAELAAAWAEEVAAHPEVFGAEIREGVEAGAAVPAVDYLRALCELEHARAAALLGVDALACPASPIVPPPLEAPDDVALAGRFARPFNVLDWPALVVPCGSPDAPAGLQLAAPSGREAALFFLGAQVAPKRVDRPVQRSGAASGT